MGEADSVSVRWIGAAGFKSNGLHDAAIWIRLAMLADSSAWRSRRQPQRDQTGSPQAVRGIPHRAAATEGCRQVAHELECVLPPVVQRAVSDRHDPDALGSNPQQPMINPAAILPSGTTSARPAGEIPSTCWMPDSANGTCQPPQITAVTMTAPRTLVRSTSLGRSHACPPPPRTTPGTTRQRDRSQR
jgi:hypothetical protein